MTRIHESEETDREVRDEAEKAFGKVRDYLARHEDYLENVLQPFDNSHMGRGFALRGVRVGLPRDLIILFIARNKKAGGSAISGAIGKLPDGSTVLVVASLLEEGSARYLPTRFGTSGMKTFIHEYVHYLLERRHGGRLKGAGDAARAGDDAAYFNHPDETNAYYQEAAFEMTRFGRALLNPMVPEWVRNEWATKSIPDLLSHMKGSSLPKDFLAHATPQTMRAFDKRAVRYLTQTFLPMLRDASDTRNPE